MQCTVKLRGAPNITSGVAVSVGHKVYVFGGLAGTTQIMVYVFNTVSLRWRTFPPVTTIGRKCPSEVPWSLRGHTAVLVEDTVYVWGGTEIKYKLCDNILYAFDVDAHRWITTRVSGSVPKGRSFHSACVSGKVMYVYGGWIRDGDTNDLYKLDTSTMVWSLINTTGTPAPASSGHSATIIGTKMFVFGGFGHQDNNIRVFDTETNCWLITASAQILPEQRGGHAAFVYNGELYIFGGEKLKPDHGFETCHDMWKFSPETFSWTEVENKENDPFWKVEGCCCMVGSCVFIFGGFKGGFTRKNDLYIQDFSPSLKTLCKLAVIQFGLEQSGLPHNIRWELAPMTGGGLEDCMKYRPK